MSQFQYQTTVKDIWVDHNQHMNDAEYNRVFSDATDAWLASLGLDMNTIKKLNYTVFTLENHVVYLKEINVDELITVNVSLYDYDTRRLHVFMTLVDAQNNRCATYEVMLMGMDTTIGRPAAFPEQIKNAIDEYAKVGTIHEAPKELGRLIGIKRK